MESPSAVSPDKARTYLKGARMLYAEATELLESEPEEWKGETREELNSRAEDLLKQAVFGSTLAVCILEGGIVA